MKHLIKSSIKEKGIKKSVISSEIDNYLKQKNRFGVQIELIIVGKDHIKSLNKKFMKKDEVTDVLSFPLKNIPGEHPELIGTIIICSDIIKKNAKEKKISFEDEFIFVLRHGIDHLLGIHHS